MRRYGILLPRAHIITMVWKHGNIHFSQQIGCVSRRTMQRASLFSTYTCISCWKTDSESLLFANNRRSYFPIFGISLLSENRMELPTQTGCFFWSKWNDWPLYPSLQPWAHPVQDWRGAACATPLRLKLHIPYTGTFLCCPHNLGRFNRTLPFTIYRIIFPVKESYFPPLCINRTTLHV